MTSRQYYIDSGKDSTVATMELWLLKLMKLVGMGKPMVLIREKTLAKFKTNWKSLWTSCGKQKKK